MKKIIIGCFTIALITISAHIQVTGRQISQARCNLTEANSPAVRGVRLGMSLDQLLALFPGSSKRREMKDSLERAKAPAGSESVYLAFYSTDTSGEQFAGVDSVSVGVHKGRVVDYSVLYVGPTWNSIDEWVAKLSEALGLPGAKAWTVGPSENPNKILKCKGVEIEAAIQGGGSSIRIRNMEYGKGMEGHTHTGEEKKQRDFKP